MNLTGAPLAAPCSSTDRSSTAKAPVGSRAYSEDGEYVYVKAAAAVTGSGVAVMGNGGTLSASGVIKTPATADKPFFGVAEVPFASGEYGYVKVKGPCDIALASGTTAGSYLATVATSGTLGAVTTSGTSRAVSLVAGNDDGVTPVACFLL